MTAALMCGLIALTCGAVLGPSRTAGLPGRSRRLAATGHDGAAGTVGPLPQLRALISTLLRTSKDTNVSVEFLVTDVASLLRAGASPAEAWWDGAQVQVDARGVPHSEALRNQLRKSGPAQGTILRKLGRKSGFGSGDQPAAQQAAGIVAGCAVAQELGAPLAPVLESVARSVVLAEQGRTDRDTALAGPKSTARILGWLPIFGIVLASALGADPIGFLLGGPVGIATAAAGVGLMLIGRKWISHLINHARQAGDSA